MGYNNNNLFRWIGSIVASITLVYPYLKNGANIKSVYPPSILIISLIFISFIVIYSRKSKGGMDAKSELFVFLVDLICLGTAIYNKLPIIPFILFWIIAFNFKTIVAGVLFIFYWFAILFINFLEKKPICKLSSIFDFGSIKNLILIRDAKNEVTNTKNPPVIYANNLDIIKNWKGYAFNILLLKGEQIELQKEKYSGTKGKAKYNFKLKVDYTSSKFGIYSNAGKQVIRNWNQNSAKKLTKDFEKIDNFFRNDDMTPIKLSNDVYYRWSSGGVLPIVKYNNETWYVFFVRNINPVGLNIANGASESKEEHNNLLRLAVREFNEETCVVEIGEKKGDYYSGIQKEFKLPSDFYPNRRIKEEMDNELKSRKFISHQRYKRNQGEFNNRLNLVKDYIEVSQVTGTGFSIKINEGKPELEETINNVIFNINPYENGIECVKLFKFNLEETDTILYGEISEMSDSLLREAVVLISAEYLKTYFDTVGSLGTHYKESPYRDCKYKYLPDEAYHIFGFDIDERQKIHEKLKKELKKDIVENNGKEEIKGTIRRLIKKKKFEEYKYHRDWIEKNKICFIKDDKIEGEYKINNNYKNEHNVNPLKFLCPVSWKTIETILKNDLEIYLDRDAKDNNIVNEKRKFYKEYISKYIEKEKKASEEIASS